MIGDPNPIFDALVRERGGFPVWRFVATSKQRRRARQQAGRLWKRAAS